MNTKDLRNTNKRIASNILRRRFTISKRSSVVAFPFVIVLLFSCISGAQNTFARKIVLPGTPAAIIATTDGGSLFVLSKGDSFFGFGSLLVRKVSASGQKIWQRELQLPDLSQDQSFTGGGVTQLADGGYVVTAVRTGFTIDLATSSEAFLTKLTAAGEIESQKAFGDSDSNAAKFDSVVASPNGGFVAAGLLNIFDPFGMFDPTGIMVASLDANSEIRWGRIFNPRDFFFPVLPPLQSLTLLQTPSQSLFLICRRLITQNGEIVGPLIIKVGVNGNLLWKKRIQATGLNLVSAAVTTGGGCVLLFDQSADDSISLVRLNGAGKITWKKRFRVSSSINHALAITKSSDGNFTIAGTSNNHGFVAKLNSAGVIVSSTVLNVGVGAPGFIVQSPDSGQILLAASTGGKLLLKLDSNATVPGCNRFHSVATQSLAFGPLKISTPAITIRNWTPQSLTPNIRSRPLASKSDSKLCP